MKRIADTSFKSKFFYACRFYRDDIERILDLFKERKYSVSITDKEYEYETLDDFIKNRGETPYKFTIDGKENDYQSISIDFDKRWTRVYLRSGSNDISKLIYEKIKRLCEKKELKNYLLVLYFLIIIFMIISIITKNNYFSLIGIGFLLITLYITCKEPVILRKKHEGGFWKRNKDRIIVAIISAIIGSFITFILTRTF